MRALWLADVLTDAGLTIKPLVGWENRGKELDVTIDGIMWHHTVTAPSRTDSSVDYFLGITGRADLPPPLANISTNRDGTISIIAAGRANHGGEGSWKGVSGNANWIADEMKNLATSPPFSKANPEPWPARQIESARIAAAAILTQIGRDASWLCSHAEYATPPGRKTDPHTLSMDNERRLVADLMTGEVDDMWEYLTVDAAAVRLWWDRGYLLPKTQATLDYYLDAVRTGEINNPAWGDYRNFRKAVTNGIARQKLATGTGISEARVKELIEATLVKGKFTLDAP